MKNISLDISHKVDPEHKSAILHIKKMLDEIASIRILGQDMAKICSNRCLNEIIQILDKETAEDSSLRLVIHILEQRYDFEDVLTRLQKLKQGLEEI